MWVRRALVLVFVLGVACGGDSGPDETDAALIDAAAGAADAPPPGTPDAIVIDAPPADAPTSTACPPTVDLFCTYRTQICVVKGPVGPANTSSCEPIPSDCKGDRTCDCVAEFLCEAPYDACSPGEVVNSVFCECLTCR